MTLSRKTAYLLLVLVLSSYTARGDGIWRTVSEGIVTIWLRQPCLGSSLPGRNTYKALRVYIDNDATSKLLQTVMRRGFKVGTTVTYKCHGNYLLTGPKTIECQKLGIWFRKPIDKHPYCEPACPPLKTKGEYPHGKIKSDGYNKLAPIGTLAHIECDEGYKLKTNYVKRCEQIGDKGIWSSYTDWACVEKCRKPDSVEKNYVRISGEEQDSYGEGDTVVLVCKQGYVEKTGNAEVKCVGARAKGSKFPGGWNLKPLECQAQCKKPDENHERNAELMSRMPFVDRSEAKYICKAGYVLSKGDRTLYCEKCNMVTSASYIGCEEESTELGWRGEYPSCEAKCSLPESLKNVKRDANQDAVYTKGDTFTFECEEGYISVGKSYTVTCLETDGKQHWSFTPECEQACSKLELPNGHVTYEPPGEKDSRYRQMTTARFQCNDGYHLSSNSTQRCIEGKWLNDKPKCYATCGTPPKSDTAHPSREGNSFQRGTEIKFACIQSHLPTQNSAMSMKCEQRDPEKQLSDWKSNVPTCVRACNMLNTSGHENLKPIDFEPDIPESPDKELSLVRPRTRAYFECQQGYKLVGKESKTCRESGRWDESEDVPTCKAQCEGFPKVKNGKPMMIGVARDSLYLGQGEKMQYSCDHNFVFNKAFPTSVECKNATNFSSKPNWSSPVPKCEPACHGWFDIANGGFNFSDKHVNKRSALVPLGSTVEFGCNEGFELEGANVLTCAKDHNWTPKNFPYCQKLCPAPPKSQLAQPDPDDLHAYYKPGRTVTYVCAEGAVKPPNATMQVSCSGNRDDVTFVGPLPKCNPTCGTHPLVRKAKVEWSRDQTSTEASGNQSIIGTVLKYTCDPSYVLRHKEHHSLKCLFGTTSSDAVWTGHTPICDPTCGNPIRNRTNVTIDKKLCLGHGRCRLEAEVHVHCKSGFYAPKTGMMRCEGTSLSEAVWSPALPHCVPMCSYKELTNAKHTNQSVCNQEKYCIPGRRVQLECPRGYAFEGGTPKSWPLCNGTDQVAGFAEDVPNCEEKFVEDRSEEIKKEKEERERKEKDEAKKDKMVLIIILSVGGFVILAIIIGLVIFLVVKLKRKQSNGDQTERTAVDARSVSRVLRTKRGPSTSRVSRRSGRDETKRTEQTGSRRQSSSKRGTSTRSRKERDKTSRGASARASSRNTTYDRSKMKK